MIRSINSRFLFLSSPNSSSRANSDIFPVIFPNFAISFFASKIDRFGVLIGPFPIKSNWNRSSCLSRGFTVRSANFRYEDHTSELQSRSLHDALPILSTPDFSFYPLQIAARGQIRTSFQLFFQTSQFLFSLPKLTGLVYS